jgi:glycosyltransferase involved in cell wall biosynthesis
MHICFVCVEIFAWGKYGGFGRATRTIGRELVQRGLKVSAVVPLRGDQRAVEDLDGIRVLGFKQKEILASQALYKNVDADIYHSEEPSFGTYLAQRAMPHKKHAITFRDTRTNYDWFTELRLPSMSWGQVLSNKLYEDNFLVHQAVRKADARFAASNFLVPKAHKKYHLSEPPQFLPTPVTIPAEFQKAATPTVCFNSRWDRRKRPELFFELARALPQVNFIAIGKSRDEAWDQHLRTTYGHLPNLEMVGFIDQFQGNKLSSLLGKSWVMVNTAAREGLPNAFIEAAAHGCAILSAVDPDDFSSRFGFHVQDDDFVNGLNFLLENERWRERGARGYEYVNEVFAKDEAIDQHIKMYEQLLTHQ